MSLEESAARGAERARVAAATVAPPKLLRHVLLCPSLGFGQAAGADPLLCAALPPVPPITALPSNPAASARAAAAANAAAAVDSALVLATGSAGASPVSSRPSSRAASRPPSRPASRAGSGSRSPAPFYDSYSPATDGAGASSGAAAGDDNAAARPQRVVTVGTWAQTPVLVLTVTRPLLARLRYLCDAARLAARREFLSQLPLLASWPPAARAPLARACAPRTAVAGEPVGGDVVIVTAGAIAVFAPAGTRKPLCGAPAKGFGFTQQRRSAEPRARAAAGRASDGASAAGSRTATTSDGAAADGSRGNDRLSGSPRDGTTGDDDNEAGDDAGAGADDDDDDGDDSLVPVCHLGPGSVYVRNDLFPFVTVAPALMPTSGGDIAGAAASGGCDEISAFPAPRRRYLRALTTCEYLVMSKTALVNAVLAAATTAATPAAAAAAEDADSDVVRDSATSSAAVALAALGLEARQERATGLFKMRVESEGDTPRLPLGADEVTSGALVAAATSALAPPLRLPCLFLAPIVAAAAAPAALPAWALATLLLLKDAHATFSSLETPP